MGASRGYGTIAALAVVALWQMPHSAAQSGRHGDGHAEMHDIYKHWQQPDNPSGSCCHDADCRPTRAYRDDDGHWHAWNGRSWLTVPAGKVLPTDFAGDGRSHICEKSGYVYCFTPTVPKG